MDQLKEYYALYFKTLWASIRRIGLRELFIAIISLIIGSGYYVVTHGLNSMLDQAENFLAYTVTPLIFVAFLYLVARLIESPAILYFKVLAEANKLKWDDIVLTIVRPIADNPDGACIKVCNKKLWTIQNGTAQIVNVVRDGVPRPNLDLPFVPWVKDWGARTYVQTLAAECSLEKAPLISLAAWDSNGGWLNTIDKTHTSSKISLDKDVPYKFTLEWHGEVDGRRMDEYRTLYMIKWTDSGLELMTIE